MWVYLVLSIVQLSIWGGKYTVFFNIIKLFTLPKKHHEEIMLYIKGQVNQLNVQSIASIQKVTNIHHVFISNLGVMVIYHFPIFVSLIVYKRKKIMFILNVF